MGMPGPISSSSLCSCESKSSVIFPNPNPENFIIKRIKKVNDFTVVFINYPDCTNYEGNKILVFFNVSEKEISSAKFLDPHFCDKHMSPIARFEPTDRGWEWAIKFAYNIKTK